MWAVRTTFRGVEKKVKENCGVLPTEPSAKQRAMGKIRKVNNMIDMRVYVPLLTLSTETLIEHVQPFKVFSENQIDPVEDGQKVNRTCGDSCNIEPGNINEYYKQVSNKNITE